MMNIQPYDPDGEFRKAVTSWLKQEEQGVPLSFTGTVRLDDNRDENWRVVDAIRTGAGGRITVSSDNPARDSRTMHVQRRKIEGKKIVVYEVH